jgi:hypothetical protein
MPVPASPAPLSPHTACVYVLILIYLSVLILLYMSSYYCICPHTIICVLILLYMSSYYYMCPHTAVSVLILLYVCSYCCICPYTIICVGILQRRSRSGRRHSRTGCRPSSCTASRAGASQVPAICPHTVRILLYICPHTVRIGLGPRRCLRYVRILSAYYYIYVRILSAYGWGLAGAHIYDPILLYICPHTTIYMSPYYCIYVRILLYICPHTTIYMSAYYYIYVRILLYIYPHTFRILL